MHKNRSILYLPINFIERKLTNETLYKNFIVYGTGCAFLRCFFVLWRM